MRFNDWLLSDSPRSRNQARAGRVYRGWLVFRRNPLAVAGLVVVVALLSVAMVGPGLVGHSPYAQNLANRLAPPGAEHWLGTDGLGRDILARMVHGTRITLATVVLVAVSVAPVGLVAGAVAGTLGGWPDRVLSRLADVFLAFPRLVLALALVAALGPGLDNAILAIALTAWPPYARVARAEAAAIRGRDFIAAARMTGAGRMRIVWTQVVPLCLPSLVVRLTLDMAGIVLTAAGLGFLGLGAQPPLPEWGAMVAAGRSVLLDRWWVATIPGAAILLASLGFNLLGDGLRDVLDPKGG